MDDQRYFLNPEAVSKHLYCSICQDVFNDPQRAPCGHSFCKNCIHCWLKQSRTCPEDRSSVTKKDLHYDFILANIIGDQMVACPFRNKGCEYIGKLELLTSHRKTCTFNPNNLPDFMKEDEVLKSSSVLPLSDSDADSDGEKLPTPAKPSLKMRLFCDENKRQLLKSVFENRENFPPSSGSSQSNCNKWLSKNDSKKARKIELLTIDDIDDSF